METTAQIFFLLVWWLWTSLSELLYPLLGNCHLGLLEDRRRFRTMGPLAQCLVMPIPGNCLPGRSLWKCTDYWTPFVHSYIVCILGTQHKLLFGVLKNAYQKKEKVSVNSNQKIEMHWDIQGFSTCILFTDSSTFAQDVTLCTTILRLTLWVIEVCSLFQEEEILVGSNQLQQMVPHASRPVGHSSTIGSNSLGH